jgi:hypothetical protein
MNPTNQNNNINSTPPGNNNINSVPQNNINRNFMGRGNSGGSQGGYQGHFNSFNARGAQNMMPIRSAGCQSAMPFSHSYSGFVPAVTIVLVWVFLFFGIIAFAKLIFSSNRTLVQRSGSTSVQKTENKSE